MDDATLDAVPLASAAAWSPTAAPQPNAAAPLLTLEDGDYGEATTGSDVHARPGEGEGGDAAEPGAVVVAPAVEAPAADAVDRLAALRDIARRLRSAPESDDTLQFVIDQACACTGSDAAMLTLAAPASRQFVAGSALGAGPYISIPLRAGGPSFGEIVLTRMADADEYQSQDETFGELVAEYVAKGIATQRAGTVLSQEEQDFVDRITEELRSPLAGAVNSLAAVLGGPAGELSDDARRYLGTAASDARRLLGSVDDLLTLAHLRAPELRQMEAVPVGPWLERNVERFQPVAADRGVTLTYRPTPAAAVIQGVPAQLDAVIGALISNGIRFTEAGGRVDVTAGEVDDVVQVSVRDTGIGFDQGEANRMTELFVRALSAEAARIPGMGVGLFLANEVVKHHQGRLWLESRRDEGTQAHVAFPPRTEAV